MRRVSPPVVAADADGSVDDDAADAARMLLSRVISLPLFVAPAAAYFAVL